MRTTVVCRYIHTYVCMYVCMCNVVAFLFFFSSQRKGELTANLSPFSFHKVRFRFEASQVGGREMNSTFCKTCRKKT
jgi:hypothetical protein